MTGNKNITTFIEKAIYNFGIDSEKFTYTELNTNYLRCLYNVFYLQQELTKIIPDDTLEEVETKFNKLKATTKRIKIIIIPANQS